MSAEKYIKEEKKRLYGHSDIVVNYSEAAVISFMETYLKLYNMKPKTLTFTEQFLDEEVPKVVPKGVPHFRGLTAFMDDQSIFFIEYVPMENEDENLTHFEFDTSIGDTEFRKKVYKLKPKTKEEAKKLAQELFNEYVCSFCVPNHIK